MAPPSLPAKQFAFQVPPGFASTHILVTVSLRKIHQSKDRMIAPVVAVLDFTVNAAKVSGVRKSLAHYQPGMPPIAAPILAYSKRKGRILVERDAEVLAVLFKDYGLDELDVAVPVGDAERLSRLK